MYWGLGLWEWVYTTFVLSMFVSETFSLLPPVDVGQRPNHVNPWCSFLCVVVFFFFFLCSYYLFVRTLLVLHLGHLDQPVKQLMAMIWSMQILLIASKLIEIAKNAALASAQRGSPFTSIPIHAWMMLPKWLQQIAGIHCLVSQQHQILRSWWFRLSNISQGMNLQNLAYRL